MNSIKTGFNPVHPGVGGPAGTKPVRTPVHTPLTQPGGPLQPMQHASANANASNALSGRSLPRANLSMLRPPAEKAPAEKAAPEKPSTETPAITTPAAEDAPVAGTGGIPADVMGEVEKMVFSMANEGMQQTNKALKKIGEKDEDDIDDDDDD